jgi:hypothetical protein
MTGELTVVAAGVFLRIGWAGWPMQTKSVTSDAWPCQFRRDLSRDTSTLCRGVPKHERAESSGYEPDSLTWHLGPSGSWKWVALRSVVLIGLASCGVRINLTRLSNPAFLMRKSGSGPSRCRVDRGARHAALRNGHGDSRPQREVPPFMAKTRHSSSKTDRS